MNYKSKIPLILVFFVQLIVCDTQQNKIKESSFIIEKKDTLNIPIEYIESVLVDRYLSTNKTELFIGIG